MGVPAADIPSLPTREEHLRWCKQRALEYLEGGDLVGAFGSMGSDLDKHPDTCGHSAVRLGVMLMMAGGLSTQEEMRNFINGFN